MWLTIGAIIKSARSAYEQAALAAAKTKDRQNILIAKMNLARVAIADGRSQSAVSELRAAIQQADSSSSEILLAPQSVDLAEAMIKSKDYLHARQELENALGSSEKLGLAPGNCPNSLFPRRRSPTWRKC